MGREIKYIVRLESAERDQLQQMVDEGRGSKSVRQRARVLLKTDQADGAPAWSDERVAEFAEVSLSTVHRVRQRRELALQGRSVAHAGDRLTTTAGCAPRWRR